MLECNPKLSMYLGDNGILPVKIELQQINHRFRNESAFVKFFQLPSILFHCLEISFCLSLISQRRFFSRVFDFRVLIEVPLH